MNRSARIVKLETRSGICRFPRVSDLSDAERHKRILSVTEHLGGPQKVRVILAETKPHLLYAFNQVMRDGA